MGYYCKRKFYTKVHNLENGMWSFGIGLSHLKDETYFLYLNFYRWNIKIGYMYEWEVRR